MAVSGSMMNPSIETAPTSVAPIQTTQLAAVSSSPITTKAEARTSATDSSLQQNKKTGSAIAQKAGNPNSNAGVEAAVRAFFADKPLMPEIARCESKFRQFGPDGDVLRGKVVYEDTGAFQVNSTYHGARAAKLGLDLAVLHDNMLYARILQEEQGYWPWISSWPCWGKSPHAAAFNAQREARLAAKAQKAQNVAAAKADADAVAQAAAAASTASVADAPQNGIPVSSVTTVVNPAAVSATASVSGAVAAPQSILAESLK